VASGCWPFQPPRRRPRGRRLAHPCPGVRRGAGGRAQGRSSARSKYIPPGLGLTRTPPRRAPQNAGCGGMCSKCHRELAQVEAQAAATAAAVARSQPAAEVASKPVEAPAAPVEQQASTGERKTPPSAREAPAPHLLLPLRLHRGARRGRAGLLRARRAPAAAPPRRPAGPCLRSPPRLSAVTQRTPSHPPPPPAAAAAAAAPSAPEEPAPKKAPTRCQHPDCKKKLGLTGFECKCTLIFCPSHRLAEAHSCTFDYKTTQRARLAENNPLVAAAKIHKF
jgi:hypothetical protein